MAELRTPRKYSDCPHSPVRRDPAIAYVGVLGVEKVSPAESIRLAKFLAKLIYSGIRGIFELCAICALTIP